uniref:J domain-containing protein n=1 Tax=Oryza punctata TaxID=4537 RepID=A0A0E0KFK9_ORYPU
MAESSSSSKQDRALQAKNLAERCFLAGDVAGAKRWCQNAQKLDPELPGVAQAAAAYDVHSAAARKAIGVAGCGPDWYAVLGLPQPRSGLVTHHDAVKKQYRKLCLLVHPDKNTSAAADGAFKLVQTAWDVLSTRHPPPGAAAASACTPPMREEELFRTKPTAAAPAKTTPSQQPPKPQQSAPRRPQVVQMRRPAQTKQHRPTMPPPPPLVTRPSPTRGKCQYCDAAMSKSFRCMSCHRSPMDNKPGYSDNDEYDDYYYHDDR